MPRPLAFNLVNQRFGRLLVVSKAAPQFKGQTTRFACLCDCGKDAVVFSSDLRRGLTTSCGCLASEKLAERNRLHPTHTPRYIKHGHLRQGQCSPEYHSWSGMCSRCLNPNATGYENYGGRGIRICDRWLGEHGFENFLADMGPRPENKTLDRKNNDGNYEPSNCRWATASEQQSNQRRQLAVAA